MAKNNDTLLKELKDAVHEYKKAKGRATEYNHSRTIRSAELGERLSKVKEQMDAGDFTGLGDVTNYKDLYAVIGVTRRWAEKLVERHRNPGKKDASSVRIIALKEGSVIKIGTTLFKVLGAPENEDEVVRTKVKGQYRVSLLLATPDNPRAVAHAKRALQQAANLADEVPPKKLSASEVEAQINDFVGNLCSTPSSEMTEAQIGSPSWLLIKFDEAVALHPEWGGNHSRIWKARAKLAKHVERLKQQSKAKTIRLCKEEKERRLKHSIQNETKELLEEAVRSGAMRTMPNMITQSPVLHYSGYSNPFSNASDYPEDRADSICGLMYDGVSVTCTSDMEKISCPDCLKALPQEMANAKQRLDAAIAAYRTSPDDGDVEFEFWKAQKSYKYLAEALRTLCPEVVQ